MENKNGYYYVRVEGHLRCEKATGPVVAAIQAFGTVTPGQEVKFIGIRRPSRLPQKTLHDLQHNPEGWVSVLSLAKKARETAE
jgi:hypothetical protein